MCILYCEQRDHRINRIEYFSHRGFHTECVNVNVVCLLYGQLVARAYRRRGKEVYKQQNQNKRGDKREGSP